MLMMPIFLSDAFHPLLSVSLLPFSLDEKSNLASVIIRSIIVFTTMVVLEMLFLYRASARVY